MTIMFPNRGQRWMWLEFYASTLNTAYVAEVLADCQQANVSDLMVNLYWSDGLLLHSDLYTESAQRLDGEVVFDYVIAEADKVGVRIHIFWCSGLWNYITSHRIAGQPSAWNTANLPDCSDTWMNYGDATYIAAMADAAEDWLDENPGLAGIHLDMIRYLEGMADGSASLEDTDPRDAVEAVHAVTLPRALKLTCAVIDRDSADPNRWSQDFVSWLAGGYMELALTMSYRNAAGVDNNLTYHLDPYVTPLVKSKIVVCNCPYVSGAWVSCAEWGAIIDVAPDHGYAHGVFSHVYIRESNEDPCYLRGLEEGFDGLHDYYTAADAAELTLQDGDWCIGVWTRVESNDGSLYQYLISIGTLGAANSFNLYLREHSASNPDRWALYVADGGGDGPGVIYSSTAPGGDDVWRLIICQRDAVAGEIQMWFCEPDGSAVKVASGADTSFNAVNGGTWYIGCRSDLSASRYFHGRICEFFKGDFCLTQAQIEALGAGLPIKALAKGMGETLDVYWPMWELVATMTDWSGNGNSGTRHSHPRKWSHAPVCTPVKRRRIG